MNKLWVDDLRDPTDYVGEGWKWVKTYDAAIDVIQSHQFETIALDNDLGEEKEGCDIFNFIEDALSNEESFVDQLHQIYIHSSNISAVNKMMGAKNIFKEKYNITITRIFL